MIIIGKWSSHCESSFGSIVSYTYFNDLFDVQMDSAFLKVSFPRTAHEELPLSDQFILFKRQSRYLRRFVDWEYAQSFHIKMACLSFLLGIIHAIAHLTGTYRHGLQHPQALAFQLSQMKSETTIPSTYLGFMKWRASWTGLTALGIFTIMFVTSMPKIRRRYFELFQVRERMKEERQT